MCQLLCENPAKLYGVYPNKGAIAEGSDADIVVFDPEKRERDLCGKHMPIIQYR